MIGEITKGYIDWIMIGVIQKDGIEIIRIIQLIINLNNTIIINNNQIQMKKPYRYNQFENPYSLTDNQTVYKGIILRLWSIIQ